MTSLTQIEDYKFQSKKMEAPTSIIKQDNYLIQNNAIQKKTIFPIGKYEDNSLINFCNKNKIKWMPIKLTIKDGEKDLEPIYHKLYNGRPKMTDFQTLSKEILEERQKLLMDGKNSNLFNFIAMDTSRVYHIDIDTPNYSDIFDDIMKKSPYFKSMTKTYGRHILIISDYKPDKHRVQFKCKGVELLSRQWSYAPFHIENYDKPILNLTNLEDMLENTIYKKGRNNITKNKDRYIKNEVFGQNNIDQENVSQEFEDKNHNNANIEFNKGVKFGINDVSNLLECLNDERAIDYNNWFNICCIIKNIGCDISLFHTFSKRSSKYDYDTCVKLWDICDKGGINIGTLILYAKNDNPKKYFDLIKTKNDNFKKKFIDNINKDNIIFCSDDNDACIYLFNLLKDKFKSYKGRLFLLNENIWLDDENYIKEVIKHKILNSKIYLSNDKYKLIPYSQNISKCENILKVLINKIIVENEDLDLYDKFHASTKNLICFDDGVLYFKDKKFIEWHNVKNVYSTIKINRNYKDYFKNPDFEIINEIRKNIFENSYGNKINDALHFLSRALTGNIADKRWGTYLGNRNSGKGVEYDLLKYGFCDYVKSFELSNMMYCRKTSGLENIDASKKLYWLMDLEFTRLAISQEIPDTKSDLFITPTDI